MRNFIYTLLAILGFVLCSLVSVDGAKGAVQSHRCHVHAQIAVSDAREDVWNIVATASKHTSCPFANRVFQASLKFIYRHGGTGDGDFYVHAHSPVTGLNYRLHCFAHGSVFLSNERMHVRCVGTNGIEVRYVA